MSVLAHDSETSVTSKDQLIGYFARGEKPKMDWKIGCEHEKFPYRLTTLQPVSYQEQNGIRDLLSGLTDYGWKPVMEGTTVIGLTRGDAAISLEPGGAVELAGAPQPDLHEVSAEIEQHLTEACDIGEQLGIGFLGMGFHPTAKRDDVPWMPKKRYEIMVTAQPRA